MSARFAAMWEALAVDPAERTGPRRRDVVLVALLLLGAIADVVFDDWSLPVLRLAVSAVAIGMLPWRRSASLATVLAAFGAQFLLTLGVELGGRDEAAEVTLAQAIAGIILIYALCRYESPPRLGVGLAVGVGLATMGEGIVTSDLLTSLWDLIPWAIVAAFALAMRYRSALRQSQVREARLSERNALARELHDSVAHHVSAIAVQAQAAGYVSDSDPAAARAAIASIEETANRAIDEMRQMVGTLRSDDDFARSVIPRTLSELADATCRPRVVVDGDADLSSLPAPVAAAVYRIAQEAVTNARRHASGATFVDVRCRIGDQLVELEVVNDGPSPQRRVAGGFGLIGMEERAVSLGGTFEAGPRTANGWSVRAELPVECA